jgi:phenylacetaldehyde dehydrogenase
MAPVPHIIGNDQVPSLSGSTFTTLNPASGEILATVAKGEPADVDRAVTTANEAFESGIWARCEPEKRSDIMRRLARRIREEADLLAEIESADSGKPIAQAREEIDAGAGFFDHFSALASLPNGNVYPTGPGHFAYSIREPYGVVGAIAPWNFPFLLACWKTAPALAVGNSVVLKMAEQTPLTTHHLGRLALESGLPPGVLNVVNGDGATGAALVAHPDVPKITFTGSTAVGQEIVRSSADHLKSLHLELGGKTPNIVFDDADMAAALTGSVFTGFHNTGQICTSGSRLLVHKTVADEFVADLTDSVGSLQVGDPLSPDTRLGPVVSRDQLERVAGYLEAGRAEGARVVTGGGVIEGDGYFVEPTVFTGVTPDMTIAREEIFGPVLSVMTFESEEEAIDLANNIMYGLAATLWTNDIGRAFRVAEGINAGIIWTNCPHYLPLNVPYEGHKMSGLGEDLGVESAHEFTQLKSHLMAFDT